MNDFDIEDGFDIEPALPISDGRAIAPEFLLTASHVNKVRFDPVNKGYSFKQVETFTEQVGEALAYYEAHVQELEMELNQAIIESDDYAEKYTSIKATLEVFRAKGDAVVDASGGYATEKTSEVDMNRIAELESELQNLRLVNAQQVSSIDVLTEELNRVENAAAEKQSLVGETSQLMMRVGELEVELEAAEKRAIESEDSEFELRNWVDSKLPEWKTQVKQKAQQAANTIGKLERQLEALRTEHDSALESHETAMVELTEEIGELRELYKSTKQQLLFYRAKEEKQEEQRKRVLEEARVRREERASKLALLQAELDEDLVEPEPELEPEPEPEPEPESKPVVKKVAKAKKKAEKTPSPGKEEKKDISDTEVEELKAKLAALEAQVKQQPEPSDETEPTEEATATDSSESENEEGTQEVPEPPSEPNPSPKSRFANPPSNEAAEDDDSWDNPEPAASPDTPEPIEHNLPKADSALPSVLLQNAPELQ